MQRNVCKKVVELGLIATEVEYPLLRACSSSAALRAAGLHTHVRTHRTSSDPAYLHTYVYLPMKREEEECCYFRNPGLILVCFVRTAIRAAGGFHTVACQKGGCSTRSYSSIFHRLYFCSQATFILGESSETILLFVDSGCSEVSHSPLDVRND